MARTKQKSKKVASASRKAPGDSGNREGAVANLGHGGRDGYFQRRGMYPGDLKCGSLICAFNNAMGGRLITTDAMVFARKQLVAAAAASGKSDAYFGTDESGIGDWPIEVLQCALRSCLAQQGVVSIVRCEFDNCAQDKERGEIKAYMLDLTRNTNASCIVELQFPATLEEEGGIGGPWRSVPPNMLGQKTHFVGVRNGLVYDSLSHKLAPPLTVKAYSHWVFARYVYRVVAPALVLSQEGGSGRNSDGSKRDGGGGVGAEHAPES